MNRAPRASETDSRGLVRGHVACDPRRIVRAVRLSFVALASCISFARGGGSVNDRGCNVTYDRPPGQTCWTTDGQTFGCVPSGPGVLGSR